MGLEVILYINQLIYGYAKAGGLETASQQFNSR